MCLETAACVTGQGAILAGTALVTMLTDCAELCQAMADMAS
ncbi:hypothetical protein [Sphingomonas sp. KC8]|nr:hypothetical protein [Sphingomonas sp. KC8]